MAWYRTGTVALTNGSKTVTGAGTSFLANVKAGDIFVGPDAALYEVGSVDSVSSLTLGTPYTGATNAAAAYVIVPTTINLKALAQQVADLITLYNTVPANVTGAQEAAAAAATSETNAASSATHAATSETNAASSAAAVTAALLSFNKLWLGPHDADPTTDNNGEPLQEGAMYENTSTTPSKIRIYHDDAWQDYSADAEAATAAAQLSATNAATSETNAAVSATASANSAKASAVSAASVVEVVNNFNGLVEIAVTDAGVTLDSTQFINGVLTFTGELDGDTIVTVPATSHAFIAINRTTGDHSLTVAMTGGTASAPVIQGYAANLVCDGTTGVYAASSNGGSAAAVLDWVQPAAGATFIAYPHIVGQAFLMQRGVWTEQAVDYTEDTTGFYLQGYTADGTEKFGVLALNAVTFANALVASNNLSDITNPATARVNLGLALAMHGRCRLAYVSSSQVRLTPYNGNTLVINGALQTIPSAGVNLSNSGLTVSTLYYVYAYMSGTTLTLEASTTVRATDTTTGIMVKSGDSSRTLVGMVYCDSGGIFRDEAANRMVASWFNKRRRAAGISPFASNTTTSTTPVALGSGITLVAWSDEMVYMHCEAVVGQNTANQTVALQIWYDGVAQGAQGRMQAYAANQVGSVASRLAVAASTEALHQLQGAGCAFGSGTGTFYSGWLEVSSNI